MFPEYDVIVVGAGHAGCEAAVASANLGSRVLLITMNMQTIAQMSCNPAMGGVAKGQIVREIDALGGYSGIVTDNTMIQFRMLNLSKGPAMWSPRAQSDRMEFARKWREMLEAHPNIDFWQDMVSGLIIDKKQVKGVHTQIGGEIKGKSVVLTNGTFLNGIIHIGEKQFSGGRIHESSAKGLTEQLKELGFEAGRMKTGTPPRIDGRSINYELLEIQPGDTDPGKFSFTETPVLKDQIPCHITYTDTEVHNVLKTGFLKSPLFTGRIKGIGPRYCPSIEDKIERFSDKERHQLFVEPEGRNTNEVYINGFSSSLPEDVQYNALKKIRGFEGVKMFRPGYAIEYDYFPPTQLKRTLETHLIKNLFFAGQINGTTGYEEAGGQGIIAGINAHLSINDKEEFILNRDQAYIGVLIDDLINKGTDEPYRMFTSRAEYRILLRQDNADIRLTPLAYELGIKDCDIRMEKVKEKLLCESEINAIFNEISVSPEEINNYLILKGSAVISQKMKLKQILLRPNISIADLKDALPALNSFIGKYPKEYITFAEIGIKYLGYIDREKEMAQKMNRLETIKINPEFDYRKLNSLSFEAREKLSKIKPNTIGQASRISGVSPSDISVLLIHMGR
ncbi:MAG: tRNA uridine-5-carboxymethylaminomethyl(34) synthesis enzyme MnmG [Saprospiraceae bacterium]|nr:tRNA uridine-5-carboxymethylaminomethyl(34) synthesis enzyme MnmG [Saprospiraceae bacterium]